jgi:hypothetical protein
MLMTMPKKLWLLAAIVAPGLALADEPAPQAQALAITEAIVEHCAKLIPADADRYREQARLITQGASEETLAKVRKSDEYQQSREATLESLAKVDEKDAKKACAQNPAQNH